MKKIALVHEWLTSHAGSEKVVEQILDIYPHADLYSLVDFLPENLRGFIKSKPVTTSFIQKLPFAERRFRSYLPLMPLAVEQFDLSAYDLIISSHHAVDKGVITRPDQLHISYVHNAPAVWMGAAAPVPAPSRTHARPQKRADSRHFTLHTPLGRGQCQPR